MAGVPGGARQGSVRAFASYHFSNAAGEGFDMNVLLWQNGSMEKSDHQAKPKRSMGPRDISDLAGRLGGRVLRRHGFAQDKLVSQWPELVGPQFAEASLPVKLSFTPGAKRGGTLTVRIEGPLALHMQHVQDVILDRINRFFGYKAVERLRLVQGEVPPAITYRPAAAPASAPPPADVTALTDGPLKAALIQLAATFSVDNQ
jgi:hypothetical protein